LIDAAVSAVSDALFCQSATLAFVFSTFLSLHYFLSQPILLSIFRFLFIFCALTLCAMIRDFSNAAATPAFTPASCRRRRADTFFSLFSFAITLPFFDTLSFFLSFSIISFFRCCCLRCFRFSSRQIAAFRRFRHYQHIFTAFADFGRRHAAFISLINSIFFAALLSFISLFLLDFRHLFSLIDFLRFQPLPLLRSFSAFIDTPIADIFSFATLASTAAT
jgi:hypothetical protein